MHTVTSPPLLSYPDFHQPFILYVNASTKGLGCSLYQQNWGKFYVLGLVEELYQNQKKGITVQSWNSWHLIEQFSVISENMFHIHQRVRLTLATTLLFIFWNQQSLAINWSTVGEWAGWFNLQIHCKPSRDYQVADTLSIVGSKETYIKHKYTSRAE